jgi:hypothetical protein
MGGFRPGSFGGSQIGLQLVGQTGDNLLFEQTFIHQTTIDTANILLSAQWRITLEHFPQCPSQWCG